MLAAKKDDRGLGKTRKNEIRDNDAKYLKERDN